MASRVFNNIYLYNEHGAFQQIIVGNLVVLLWFAFDAMENLIQLYAGSILLEWSQAIANDIQMHHFDQQAMCGIHNHGYANKYQLGK